MILLLISIFFTLAVAAPVVRPVSDLSPKHLVQCGDSFYNTTTSVCVNGSIRPLIGGRDTHGSQPSLSEETCYTAQPKPSYCGSESLQPPRRYGRDRGPLLEGVPLPSFAHPYDEHGNSTGSGDNQTTATTSSASATSSAPTPSSPLLDRENAPIGFSDSQRIYDVQQNQVPPTPESAASTDSDDDGSIAREDRSTPATTPTTTSPSPSSLSSYSPSLSFSNTASTNSKRNSVDAKDGIKNAAIKHQPDSHPYPAQAHPNYKYRPAGRSSLKTTPTAHASIENSKRDEATKHVDQAGPPLWWDRTKQYDDKNEYEPSAWPVLGSGEQGSEGF